MWRNPVGLGAKRTRGFMVLRRVQERVGTARPHNLRSGRERKNRLRRRDVLGTSRPHPFLERALHGFESDNSFRVLAIGVDNIEGFRGPSIKTIWPNSRSLDKGQA